jgi:hypothetical protein
MASHLTARPAGPGFPRAILRTCSSSFILGDAHERVLRRTIELTQDAYELQAKLGQGPMRAGQPFGLTALTACETTPQLCRIM